jgi:hypothetical protein
MVATILLAFLADAVFQSAASLHRSTTSEVARYFEQRGARRARPRRPARLTRPTRTR